MKQTSSTALNTRAPPLPFFQRPLRTRQSLQWRKRFPRGGDVGRRYVATARCGGGEPHWELLQSKGRQHPTQLSKAGPGGWGTFGPLRRRQPKRPLTASSRGTGTNPPTAAKDYQPPPSKSCFWCPLLTMCFPHRKNIWQKQDERTSREPPCPAISQDGGGGFLSFDSPHVVGIGVALPQAFSSAPPPGLLGKGARQVTGRLSRGASTLDTRLLGSQGDQWSIPLLPPQEPRHSSRPFKPLPALKAASPCWEIPGVSK